MKNIIIYLKGFRQYDWAILLWAFYSLLFGLIYVHKSDVTLVELFTCYADTFDDEEVWTVRQKIYIRGFFPWVMIWVAGSIEIMKYEKYWLFNWIRMARYWFYRKFQRK